MQSKVEQLQVYPQCSYCSQL